MERTYIQIIETGERRTIERPVWLTKNRNGILTTPHRVKAMGVGDGENIWSFGSLDGYPEARLITRAEYEESLYGPEAELQLTAQEALEIITGGMT